MNILLRYGLFFHFLAGHLQVVSQDLNFPGLAPSVSLTVHQSDLNWNFLLATKTREGIHSIKNIRYDPQILEIYSQVTASRKLSEHSQLALGYGFQRNNPFSRNRRNEHRLIQQIQVSMPSGKWKFNQRFRIEERVFDFPASPTRLGTRVRYQPSALFQINRKYYWQGYYEIYAIPSGPRNNFISEHWLYSGIGFPVKNLGHMEAGIGYNAAIRNTEKEYLNLFVLQLNWSFVVPSAMKMDMHPVMHARHF